MKLISMTDFVLQMVETKTMKLSKIANYAKFLKQPLELWMFVPCDRTGVVLISGKNCEEHYFQKAKERCFFEGFTNSDEKEKSFVFTVNGVDGYWIRKDDTIEELMLNFIPDYIELTPTAIKQIGL